MATPVGWPGSEVREHVPDENTRINRPCPWQMRQNAHRSGFFGDLVVDLDIKALRRRYGAERADSQRRPLQARRGRTSAKKPRRKAVRGGRDPQKKRCQISLRTIIGIFMHVLFSRRSALYFGWGCMAGFISFLPNWFRLLDVSVASSRLLTGNFTIWIYQ